MSVDILGRFRHNVDNRDGLKFYFGYRTQLVGVHKEGSLCSMHDTKKKVLSYNIVH